MAQQTREGPEEPGRWQVWGPLAGCLALALFAYRDLVRFQVDQKLPEELEQWFFVPSDSLGPLVLGLSAWLFYRRADRLRQLPCASGSAGIGGLLVAAGLAVYAWATYTMASDLLIPALMLHLSAGLWLWKGGAALRVSSLPVGILLFAIPIPSPALNELVFWLQIATTEIAGFFLYAMGIPHFVAGEQILRTENTFSVIESCSGLRSIQTLTLVSVLMADLFRRGALHAWLLVLAAPPVAFFLNGVRALLLILNPHSEVVAIHNLQGVAILLGGLVLLFFWDDLLDRVLPTGAGAATDAIPAGEPGDVPRALAAVAGALVVAGVLSVGLPRFERPDPVQLDFSGRIAAGLGISAELPVDRLFLGSVGFQQSFTRRFEAGDDDVVLFLGVGDRSHRVRSPLSPKTGIPASGWVVESQEDVALEDGVLVRVRVMRHGSQRMLVYHWYQGAAGLGLESLRALLALDRSPWRQPGEILAVRLGTSIHGALADGRVTAEQEILSFYRRLRPLIQGLEKDLSRKRFSGFSGSGKRFSSFLRLRDDQEVFKNNNLRGTSDTA